MVWDLYPRTTISHPLEKENSSTQNCRLSGPRYLIYLHFLLLLLGTISKDTPCIKVGKLSVARMSSWDILGYVPQNTGKLHRKGWDFEVLWELPARLFETTCFLKVSTLFFAKTNICPIDDDIQPYLLVFLGIFLGVQGPSHTFKEWDVFMSFWILPTNYTHQMWAIYNDTAKVTPKKR